MTRIPMRSGEEYDMLTGWRKYLTTRRRSAKVKRGYRRRERRAGKQETRCYNDV